MNWYSKISKKYINKTASQYLYHGTAGKGRLISIQNNGLQTGQAIGDSFNSPIYFSDTEQYAQTYSDRKGYPSYLLRIQKTSDLIPDPNTSMKGDYKTIKHISPEQIEIKTKDGNWIPIKQYDIIGESYELVRIIKISRKRLRPLYVKSRRYI